MPKTHAYIRVSADTQNLESQKLEILDYANRTGMRIDDFISIETSSRKNTQKRRIDDLFEKAEPKDTIIVTELSHIGQSMVEVINTVNELAKKKVRLIALKQGFDINGNHDPQSKAMVSLFSLLSDLKRDLVSSRTKAGLAARKAQGVKLGRPAGRLGNSKLDQHRDAIVGFLQHRVAKAAIARMLHCSRPTLVKYIKSRRLA
jgi:DNA invertase Pin-like site-specific DNA recombinase